MDNKNFWKQIKSSFSDKVICGQKITLVDDNNIISDDLQQAEVFKTFFDEAVNRLDIQENPFLLNMEEQNQDEIDGIISKFNTTLVYFKFNKK